MRRRYCSRADRPTIVLDGCPFAACLRAIYAGRVAFASCAWGVVQYSSIPEATSPMGSRSKLRQILMS